MSLLKAMIKHAMETVVLRNFYTTTRGMDIATGDPLEQATPHLKALSWLWGIGPMDVIATQNMDYVSLDEIEEKVQNAIKKGLKLVKEW